MSGLDEINNNTFIRKNVLTNSFDDNCSVSCKFLKTKFKVGNGGVIYIIYIYMYIYSSCSLEKHFTT